MTTDQLAGVRVVEAGGTIPVAWCGLNLARLGAEVVRLEPPDSHPVRHADPSPFLWEHLSRDVGVTSEVVDLSAADVVLTDRALDDADDLAASGTVVARLSDFGPGPYAGFQATDLVLQAISGYMSVNGEADRQPLRAPGNVVSFAVGSHLLVGALAALREREATGTARVVDVGALEAVASLMQYTFTEYFGEPSERKGGAGPPMLPCADGWLFFEYRFAATRRPLLEALGITEDDLPDEPAALAAFVEDRTRTWPAAELFATMSERGAVTAFMQTAADLRTDPHLLARRSIDPDDGSTATPPVRTVDQNRTDRTGPTSRARSAPGPLSGVRVADFTQAWLGPYATMLLADLGADVIKVESRSRPDVWRVLSQVPPCARPQAHKWNVSHLTNSVTRNKRCLTLDLSSVRGRELALELVASADIVTENYTPRVMERFGLGYERLCEVNPRVVMLSFSGYGRSGPYADFKGNGATIETIAGWVSLFGYGDERPLNLGDYPVDPICGAQMAAVAIAGLIDAERTGRGGYYEAAMMDIAVDHIADEVMLATTDPHARPPLGNRHRGMVPHGVFDCVDGRVAVAVRDDTDWAALRSVIGIGGDDSLDQRRARIEVIETAVANWTGERPAAEAMHLLQDAGVPAGVVNDTRQAMDDPHLAGWFRTIEHPDVGVRRHDGFCWRFSGLELAVRLPPPRLGEHNAEVLAELGLAPEEIEQLEASGVARSVIEFVPKKEKV